MDVSDGSWRKLWASTPRPYLRSVLLAAGVIAYALAEVMLNEVVSQHRYPPEPSGGQYAVTSAAIIGIFILVIAVTAISVAGGLTCLGAAIPGGDRRPFLALPAGAFDLEQRKLLAIAGVAMLLTALLGVLSLVLFPLILLVGVYAAPIVGLFAYLLVFAPLLSPLEADGRLLSWSLSVAIASVLFVSGVWFLTARAGIRFFVVETLLSGLPAVTVLAGYVARTPVVTYISRD